MESLISIPLSCSSDLDCFAAILEAFVYDYELCYGSSISAYYDEFVFAR